MIMDHFERLPDELISRIIHYVDQKDWYACLLVNHTFYYHYLPLLWRQLTIDSQDSLKGMTATMATSLSSCGAHVQSASIIYSLTDTDLLSFIDHVPHLKCLRIMDGVNIDDSNFQYVPQRLPQLTTLYINHANISTQSLASIDQHCHQLATLEFKGCYLLDMTDILTALRTCPLLKDIAISRAPTLRKDHPPLLDPAVFDHHYQHQPLVSLQLRDIAYDFTSLMMNPTGWPHLTCLSLDPCLTLDDDVAIPFLQAHPALERLTIRYSKITDLTLDAILMCLRKLQHFEVFGNRGLTGLGLYRLVKYSTRLQGRVHCLGCGIYDFPTAGLVYCKDYKTWVDGELQWVAANAF